jgi:hypothetical protein
MRSNTGIVRSACRRSACRSSSTRSAIRPPPPTGNWRADEARRGRVTCSPDERSDIRVAPPRISLRSCGLPLLQLPSNMIDAVRPEVICPTARFSEFASSLPAKNISLFRKRKSVVWFAPSRAHQEGVSRSSRNVVRDAMDAGRVTRRRMRPRTAKSRGPDAPTLASSLEGDPLKGDGG